MSNRFWVGGGSSANWNATGPTNWGSASNTQDNASVPGPSDDVFFDGVGTGASNSTLSASITIKSLDCTGYANTLTHNSSTVLTIAGNGVTYLLSAGMTYAKGSGTSSQTNFTGTSGTTTITTNGKVLGNITFNGVGGAWELQDALTSTGTLNVTNGSFATNDHNITVALFNSSNSNVRTISFGSSTVSITLALSVAFTFSTSTNLTFNAGTSTVKFIANSTATSGGSWGGKTFYNIWVNTTGTGVFQSTGSLTFNNLKIDAGRTFNVTTGSTLTGTSITATGTVGSIITWQSVTSTNTWNLVIGSGTIICDYLSLRDSAASGGATFYAGSHSTDVSNNSGWIFTDPPSSANTTAFFAFL